MDIPDFVIAGASKAGSGWTASCLRDHPEVVMPYGPTIDFFSKNYDEGEDWYINRLPEKECGHKVGEKSTSYIIHDRCPERMYDWNESMKILFLLRHPVQRAYSHYCMKLRAGLRSRDIDRELTLNDPLIREGRYFERIKPFIDLFGSEKVSIFLFDDLKKDPRGYIAKIYSKISVSTDYTPKLVNKKLNTTKSLPRYRSLYNKMVKLVRKMSSSSKHFAQVLEIARAYNVTNLFHMLNYGADPPKMSIEKAEKIASYYEEDIDMLSNYIGRNLQHWKDIQGLTCTKRG